MIERWQLEPSPFPQDPLRYLLRLRAPSGDLYSLVRELGSVCGRPRGEKPPFSHAMFLEGMTPPKLSRVRRLLLKVSPQGEVEASVPTKPIEAPRSAPRIPQEFAVEPEPAPAVERPAPEPERAAAEPPPPAPPVFEAEPPAQAPAPAVEQAPPAEFVIPDLPVPLSPAPSPVREAAASAPAEPAKMSASGDFVIPDLPVPLAPSPASAPEPAAPPSEPVVPDLPVPLAPEAPVSAALPLPPAPAAPVLPVPPIPAAPADLPPPQAPTVPTDPFLPDFPLTPPAPPAPSKPASQPLHPALAGLPPLPSVAEAGLVSSLPESLQVQGTPAAASAPKAESERPPAWELAWALFPERTFDSFQVGAHNRFAHAAAMSVISNVGSMYNPLNVYGGAGSGKSHLLNAIASKLASDNLGVLRTTGPRLGLAAAKEGAAFLQRFEGVRVLVVDDFDLLLLADAAKGLLPKVFSSFLSGDRQLVLASAVAPKNLSSMESAIGFSFAQGWTVEMKAPGPAAFKSIMAEAVGRSGLSLSELELSALAAKSAGSLFVLSQWMSRLKAVREIGVQDPLPALLDLFDMPGEPAPPPAAGSNFKWPGSAASPKLGLFYPKGMEAQARHVLSKVHAACGQYGLPGSFSEALSQGYEPSKGVGLIIEAMQAAEAAKLASMIILGPQQPEGGALGDLALNHAAYRAFSSLMMRCAYVSYDSADAPAAALRAGLDLSQAAPWAL